MDGHLRRPWQPGSLPFALWQIQLYKCEIANYYNAHRKEKASEHIDTVGHCCCIYEQSKDKVLLCAADPTMVLQCYWISQDENMVYFPLVAAGCPPFYWPKVYDAWYNLVTEGLIYRNKFCL